MSEQEQLVLAGDEVVRRLKRFVASCCGLQERPNHGSCGRCRDSRIALHHWHQIKFGRKEAPRAQEG